MISPGELSPELKRVKELAAELAADFAKRAAIHDRDRSAPVENYAMLRDAGFYGCVIPKEYGGMGAGLKGWMLAGEELAQGCASTALSFNMHINATGLIMESPQIPEAVKRRVADLVVREGKLIAASLSEPTSSSYAAPSFQPAVTAERVPGGYRLYGKKAFASMWEASDLVFLWAWPEGHTNPQAGISFLLPSNGEGVTVHDVWHTLGMRATRSQTVTLDGAFVPEENVVYETDQLVNSVLVTGAAWYWGAYTSVYLGVGTGILNLSRRLLTTRIPKGFAQPVGYHPDARRRVGEMACELDGARLCLWRAAEMHEAEGVTPASILQFAKAKYLTGRAVTNAAHNASIACGVHSLYHEVGLERMIRDAATAPIQPPNEDFCLGLIGLLEMGLNPDEAVMPLKFAAPVDAK